MTSTDLIDHYKLNTHFHVDCTQHIRFVSDRARGRRKVEISEKWYRVRRLGEGGYGVVWLEVERVQENQSERAIKEIPKKKAAANKVDYKKELLAMAKLSKFEELFVKFYGWFENIDTIFLAMEYFQHGDLQQHVAGGFSEHEAKSITMQLLEGLVIMHDHHFTHRDLKPENIFVVEKSPDWWVKIGDFGITKRIESDLTILKTEVGTRSFQAPEILGLTEESKEDSEYTNAVDIWALGCVTFLLLAQKAPFTELRHITSYSRGWTQLPLDTLHERKTSKEGISFIQSLIAIEPLKRPTAGAALQSAWLESLGKDEGAPSSLQNLVPRPPLQVTSWDDHSDVKPAIGFGRDGDDPLDVNRSKASPRLRASKLTSGSLSVNSMLADKQAISMSKSVASGPSKEVVGQLRLLQLNEVKEEPNFPGTTNQPITEPSGHSNNTDPTSRDDAQIIDRRFRIFAARGHTPRFAALLDKGATVGSRDLLGWTPLHLAVLSVSPPAVRMLLERGADINAETIQGLTPIDLAFAYACNGVRDVLRSWPGIKIPLPFKEKATPEDRRSFLEAAEAGSVSKVERLLEKGVSIEMEVGNGFSALHHAAQSGHEMVVRLLLSKGARVQAIARFGWTALLCASARGHLAVVELLLDAGGDISQSLKDGKSCLMLASSNGHEAIASLLRSWPDSLRKAAQIGDYLSVKNLLALAFDANERGEKGRTALHIAAAEGHVEVVLLLLKVGAEVDMLDDQQITALIAASDKGHETVARVLLDFGADIHLSDGKQGRPLNYAARGGHEDVVRLLVEKGAHIPTKDKQG